MAHAIGEPDPREGCAGTLAARAATDAPVDERELDVLERAGPREQLERLEHEPDLAVAKV